MKKLIILLFCLIPVVLNCQTMDIVWQNCYGTTKGDDSPSFTCYTDKGLFICTSVTRSDSGISNYHSGSDAWVIRMDSAHNIIWERCYGGSKADALIKMIPDNNGNYWMIGGTDSNDGDINSLTHDSYDIWAVKIDEDGNILNENCYGSYGIDAAIDAALTPDNGLIITSYITTSGGDITDFYGECDAWLLRIDSVGNILWEKTFGNESTNEFFSIKPTSDNTYLLAGLTYTPGGMITCDVDSSATVKDCWIVEIDINGDIVWQGCYGGSWHDQAITTSEVEDGFIISGSTNSDDIDVSGLHGVAGDLYIDYWVFKISRQGEIIWQNCLGGSLVESPRESFITSDSCIIIFGSTSSNDGDVSGLHGITDKDIWVVKLDWNGNLLSQKCYGSNDFGGIRFHNVSKISDYNYLISTENTWMNGDVECELDVNPYHNNTTDNWVIQLKDCHHYAAHQPQQPTGKDTLCVNTDSITTYTTIPATNAWYYKWQLQPEDAGTVEGDSLISTIHWNPNYEGPVSLKVRSTNDCGESSWSDSLVIQTYMCLGKEENAIANNLRVYPNPATNTLIVELEYLGWHPYNIQIYNSFGSVLYSAEAVNKNTKINVSNWNSGIYVVMVISGNEIYSRKVVVR